jgi:hypothetical protein
MLLLVQYKSDYIGSPWNYLYIVNFQLGAVSKSNLLSPVSHGTECKIVTRRNIKQGQCWAVIAYDVKQHKGTSCRLQSVMYIP